MAAGGGALATSFVVNFWWGSQDLDFVWGPAAAREAGWKTKHHKT